MSDAPETTGEAGGEAAKPRRRHGRATGCLTAVTPATTPGCAGCLTFVFLLTTVVTVWTAFVLDPENVPWRHSMSAWRIILVSLLVVLIPILVYKTIQWWLETETAKFPDVDFAWQAGLQALEANGIAPTSAPLYVVLGSNGEQQERALLADPGLKLRVEGVPDGPAPLHWYASKDAIYLFLSDTSWTSALGSLREELIVDARAKGLKVPDGMSIQSIIPDVVRAMATLPASASPAIPTTAQPVPSAAVAAPRPAPLPNPASASGPIGGTMMLDASMLTELMAQQSGASVPAAPPPPATALPGAGVEYAAMSPPPAVVEAPTFGASFERNELEAAESMEPVLVAPQYAATCLKQLQYVGGLLRQVRTPVCPMNGVVALIQFESIQGTAAEVDELQQALQGDLATLQYSTQCRAPVTALIVGLEKERGFREMVRRVGKDRATTQRFGRKFDVRAYPSHEQLDALASHVCGAFEDWAYTLFREENALTRPGNTLLYELLSKVRCGWKTRLAALLAGSFGADATKMGRQDSLLFSGCYLAATGETPDRQAFARGVLDKLNDEQEMVEWDRDAVRRNRRQSTLAALGMLLTLFLLCALIVMFVLARFK
jgi:hypothetical protein